MKTQLLLLAGLLSTCSFAQNIDLEVFASGFSSPIEIVTAGDDRLFVAEQGGIIKILNDDGSINPTAFLNISSLISAGGERGLLGLAFHPDYADNGYFYVNYTNTGGDTVIARYTVSGDANIADAGSAVILMTIDQPQSNHNGGCLRFGPDDYLYIATGDGGGGGDPNNLAQNIDTLLGKILRIDVDNGDPYLNPDTNPFIGVAGADEVWAYGLRNPWKFSFNRLNGDLWIADVGQNNIEEINKVLPNAPGLNYGWRCYEGTAEYNTSQCADNLAVVIPFSEYTHNSTDGCSVTGGYVYNGSDHPSLTGTYFFSDYCTNDIGMIDSIDGDITWIEGFSGGFAAFGEDNNGELYVAGKNSGVIYKIVIPDMGIADYGSQGFEIYPNPASDMVNIETREGNSASAAYIYDLSGKLLISRELENVENNSITTAGLPSGLYMIAIVDDNGSKYNYKLSIK